MRSAIFVWASLLLIGSVSISQGYPNHHQDNDENQLNDLKARLASVLESSESSESKRDEWFNAALKKRSSSCTSACKPACSSDELCLASGVCTCPGGRGASPCPTQSHGLCAPSDTAGVKPVVSITFGEGTSKYSTAKPAALGFSTSYTQSSNTKLVDGSFTIINEIPEDYKEWLGGGLDHTTSCNAGSKKGYMMAIGVKVGQNSNDILTIKADKLCLGLRYQFSIYAANIMKAGYNYIRPNLQLDVHSASGSKALIVSSSTGNIDEQKSLTWIQYGVSFIATSTSVVLSISSNAPGGRGNDVALDDITLTSCSSNTNGVCN
jgi:hypothetical protein